MQMEILKQISFNLFQISLLRDAFLASLFAFQGGNTK